MRIRVARVAVALAAVSGAVWLGASLLVSDQAISLPDAAGADGTGVASVSPTTVASAGQVTTPTPPIVPDPPAPPESPSARPSRDALGLDPARDEATVLRDHLLGRRKVIAIDLFLRERLLGGRSREAACALILEVFAGLPWQTLAPWDDDAIVEEVSVLLSLAGNPRGEFPAPEVLVAAVDAAWRAHTDDDVRLALARIGMRCSLGGWDERALAFMGYGDPKMARAGVRQTVGTGDIRGEAWAIERYRETRQGHVRGALASAILAGCPVRRGLARVLRLADAFPDTPAMADASGPLEIAAAALTDALERDAGTALAVAGEAWPRVGDQVRTVLLQEIAPRRAEEPHGPPAWRAVLASIVSETNVGLLGQFLNAAGRDPADPAVAQAVLAIAERTDLPPYVVSQAAGIAEAGRRQYPHVWRR